MFKRVVRILAVIAVISVSCHELNADYTLTLSTSTQSATLVQPIFLRVGLSTDRDARIQIGSFFCWEENSFRLESRTDKGEFEAIPSPSDLTNCGFGPPIVIQPGQTYASYELMFLAECIGKNDFPEWVELRAVQKIDGREVKSEPVRITLQRTGFEDLESFRDAYNTIRLHRSKGMFGNPTRKRDPTPVEPNEVQREWIAEMEDHNGDVELIEQIEDQRFRELVAFSKTVSQFAHSHDLETRRRLFKGLAEKLEDAQGISGEAYRVWFGEALVKAGRIAEAETVIEPVKLRSDRIDWIRRSVRGETKRRNGLSAEKPVF